VVTTKQGLDRERVMLLPLDCPYSFYETKGTRGCTYFIDKENNLQEFQITGDLQMGDLQMGYSRAKKNWDHICRPQM
jgi:hypothetical protein